MNTILKRLRENKEVFNTSIFSIEDRSDESWELYDQLDSIVKSICQRLFSGVDVDNSGLDSRGSTDSDRTIIYRADVYYYRANQDVPLKNKEAMQLEKELKQAIRLPGEDDQYDYSVKVNYASGTIEIELIRYEKLSESRRIRESEEAEELNIKINDSEGNIKELLKTIADYSKMGHSFNVVVDPGDKEREKKFWIDGDGSDKLYID